MAENVALFLLSTISFSFFFWVVPGWYSNKVGGLLGTMDQEASTDQQRPDRLNEVNVYALARSWDVTASDDDAAASCSASSSPPPPPPLPSPAADGPLAETCSGFFDVDVAGSTLRPGFAIVDPRPYQRLCRIKGSPFVLRPAFSY